MSRGPEELKRALTCPKCGRVITRTWGWLALNESIECACGEVLNHDARRWRQLLEDYKAELEPPYWPPGEVRDHKSEAD